MTGNKYIPLIFFAKTQPDIKYQQKAPFPLISPPLRFVSYFFKFFFGFFFSPCESETLKPNLPWDTVYRTVNWLSNIRHWLKNESDQENEQWKGREKASKAELHFFSAPCLFKKMSEPEQFSLSGPSKLSNNCCTSPPVFRGQMKSISGWDWCLKSPKSMNRHINICN